MLFTSIALKFHERNIFRKESVSIAAINRRRSSASSLDASLFDCRGLAAPATEQKGRVWSWGTSGAHESPEPCDCRTQGFINLTKTVVGSGR
jgi:hypothetical protein